MHPWLSCWLSGQALAAGVSADVELLRPGLSDGGAWGVESARVADAGRTRLGLVLQIEEDPLVLYENGQEVGSVVPYRATGHLGISHDWTDRLSGRLVVPVGEQWGTGLADLGSPGPGLGDISAGLRWEALERSAGSVGLRSDVMLPTGRRDAWMAEVQPRLSAGVLGTYAWRSLEASADLGTMLRSPVRLDDAIIAGTELDLGATVGFRPAAVPLSFHASVLSRHGLLTFGDAAAHAIELVGGVSSTVRGLELSLGAGRGLTSGNGTTDWRALTAVVWTPPRRTPRVRPVPTVSEMDELVDRIPVAMEQATPEPPEPLQAPVVPLARIEGHHIVPRDPIRFEKGSARLLPESLPTLRAIAEVLRDDTGIVHLLVEGHASEEGTSRFNYELSTSRARAVFEALVLEGTNPLRLSYRGLGEAEPATLGLDPHSLATNRRVEFSILRETGEGEAPPPLPEMPVPWSAAAEEKSP